MREEYNRHSAVDLTIRSACQQQAKRVTIFPRAWSSGWLVAFSCSGRPYRRGLLPRSQDIRDHQSTFESRSADAQDTTSYRHTSSRRTATGRKSQTTSRSLRATALFGTYEPKINHLQ